MSKAFQRWSWPHEWETNARLLAACLQPAPSSETQTQVRHWLSQEANWSYLMAVSERNRVRPLFYYGLQQLAPDLIPSGIATRLADYQRQITLYNLFLTRSFVEIATNLTQAGIRVLPYKGPALAYGVYRDWSLRQYGDLDILVPPDNVKQAREILQQLGYQQTWPEKPLTPHQEQQHLKQKYNFGFVHASGLPEVELHWHVTPRYLNTPPHNQPLWAYAEPQEIAGQPVWGFPPPVLLLLLCVHGANHCWLRLSWLADVVELLHQNPALDWDETLRLARAWRIERILYVGLCLAQQLLGKDLPTTVSDAVSNDQAAQALAQQSWLRLFSRRFRPFAPLEEPRYHWQMREKIADRLRYGLTMAHPSAEDWATITLPAPLYFLYYLIRPFRLTFQHGIKLMERPSANP